MISVGVEMRDDQVVILAECADRAASLLVPVVVPGADHDVGEPVIGEWSLATQ
jgi:hypothetical protein